MVIQTKFRKAGEAAVASYDYTDIAEGTGSVIYYGLNSEVSGGTVAYHLLKTKVYSQTPGKQMTGAGTTTFNFDLTAFNLPKVVKGTAYFSCGIGCEENKTANLSAQLKHYDGTTYTNITSEIQSGQFTGGGAGLRSEMVFLALPVTETHFKKGDVLRLTVKLIHVSADGTSEIGHDPMNQAMQFILPATKNSTILQVHIPFRIDL